MRPFICGVIYVSTMHIEWMGAKTNLCSFINISTSEVVIFDMPDDTPHHQAFHMRGHIWPYYRKWLIYSQNRVKIGTCSFINIFRNELWIFCLFQKMRLNETFHMQGHLCLYYAYWVNRGQNQPLLLHKYFHEWSCNFSSFRRHTPPLGLLYVGSIISHPCKVLEK